MLRGLRYPKVDKFKFLVTACHFSDAKAGCRALLVLSRRRPPDIVPVVFLPAPVAQWIEHWPPEPGAWVRVPPGVPVNLYLTIRPSISAAMTPIASYPTLRKIPRIAAWARLPSEGRSNPLR